MWKTDHWTIGKLGLPGVPCFTLFLVKPHWSLNPKHFGSKINGWLNWIQIHISKSSKQIGSISPFYIPHVIDSTWAVRLPSSGEVVRHHFIRPVRKYDQRKVWKSRGFYHVPYSYLSYWFILLFRKGMPQFSDSDSWLNQNGIASIFFQPRALMFPGWLILHGWFCWCDFWFLIFLVGSHRGREFHVFGLVLHWNFMVHHGPSWFHRPCEVETPWPDSDLNVFH